MTTDDHLFQQPGVPLVPDGYLTYGTYETEEDAAAALDIILTQCGLWTVYSEVCGSLCQPRPVQDEKGMRIDRILVPTRHLISLGWTHGVVGIEIKRSGVKIGPPIAQAMDYSRAVYVLDQIGGIRVWLDWVFIWPMPEQGSTVASILTQNRIGSASSDAWSLLKLKNGAQNLIKIDRRGDIHIGKAAANGRKAGSR